MIRDNILEVKRRIEAACFRAKRQSSGVKLIAVSKNRSIEEIEEASLAGITDFGENRVQEALSKYKAKLPIRWHMIGHLQTNKTREAVRIFDIIHSVDSLRLAEEIDKRAAKINKIQDILIEIKTSPEATKFGLEFKQAAGVIKEIANFKNINVQGLMTVAPLADNPEEARPYFRSLNELRNEINHLPVIKQPLSVLSMGMTDDFEVAIEEGSGMIRVGRAIFEGGL